MNSVQPFYESAFESIASVWVYGTHTAVSIKNYMNLNYMKQ